MVKYESEYFLKGSIYRPFFEYRCIDFGCHLILLHYIEEFVGRNSHIERCIDLSKEENLLKVYFNITKTD